MPSHAAEPRFTSTIPSIHDDTTLDFRLYLPHVLTQQPSTTDTPRKEWRKRGIVIAHPYAPMGGSYDDRVVGIVRDEFLKAGWIAATFNFRGAHGSKGRTSWSGRPELDDYISLAAFFMHYLSHVQPSPAPDSPLSPEKSPAVAQPYNDTGTADDIPVVVLAGYSYGSLILRHLPPIPSLLQPFAAPVPGSAAAEIVLRARKLAEQSNLDWATEAREHAKRRHGHNLSVTIGGEETSPEKRRRSKEIRRSMDGGGARRSLDLHLHLRGIAHRRHGDEATTSPKSPTATPNSPQAPVSPTQRHPIITVPQIRYLFVSPLTAPISTLVAPGLATRMWRGHAVEDGVLARHEALAVFGTEDVFASAKRLSEWTSRLEGVGAGFRGVVVEGAGHFWGEEGAEAGLRGALGTWAGEESG